MALRIYLMNEYREALMESPTSYALNAGVSDTPIVIIDITGRCNLKCIHCWNADFIQNELDRDTVLKIIDAAPTDARIHFLGGEPLLHSKLDEFIERASNNGKVDVSRHKWNFVR